MFVVDFYASTDTNAVLERREGGEGGWGERRRERERRGERERREWREREKWYE